MMKILIDFFLLKKEAHLFDAKLYILKAFVAVVVAFGITQRLPLIHKDIISVLFGMMMTLEPVTVTGIRSGLRQIFATFLGALATAVIIALFGINIWTIALSISATLFLCLKINWREVSPVAIFTAIYMTQYVQFSAGGEPSVFLTFQLRILALGIGVFIAILLNFIFSLFFYKQMERKRIAHLLLSISDHLRQIKKGLLKSSVEAIRHEKSLLPSTFDGIDWLSSLIKDKEKEASFKNKIHFKNQHEEVVIFQEILICLRNITHLVYDTAYVLALDVQPFSAQEQDEMVLKMDELIDRFDYLAGHYEYTVMTTDLSSHKTLENLSVNHRVMDNLVGITENLNRLAPKHNEFI
ncbi:MAG: hypothetical protein H7X94_08400 [Vallitaleaceae bacterium]|nr:hypothetical protein [Vallitaleaceae bacterium]